ncbi:MAG: flagellar basal body-associated protein FliL [Patescibacteria group bacterium]|jgi:flagellar basal body-associated protein FliL
MGFEKNIKMMLLVLLVVLMLMFGVYVYYNSTEELTAESNEKDIDLSNLPAPVEQIISITGNVIFPGQPGSPGDPSVVDDGNTDGEDATSGASGGESETSVPLCVEADWDSSIAPAECPSNGEKTKTWTKKVNADCVGGVVKPSTESVSCQYIPLCEEDKHWRFEFDFEVCPSSEMRVKTWQKISACEGGFEKQATENVPCVYEEPICTSVNYGDWRECLEGDLKHRDILSKSSSDCVLTAGQENGKVGTCNYIPSCVEFTNWVFTLNPSECPSSGKRTKVWEKVGECEGGDPKPLGVEVDCVYQAPVCEYTFSEFEECTAAGVQTRSILTISPNGCAQSSPLLIGECTPEPVCVADQVQICEMALNGEVSGYADKCASDGSGWLGENACEVVCDEGFRKDGERCVSVTVESEVDEEDVTVSTSGRVEIDGLVIEGLRITLNDFSVKRSVVGEFFEFIIIKGVDIGNGTKNVTFTRKHSSSDAVCILDEENITDYDYLLEHCVKVKCPSIGNPYSCFVSGNEVTVTGLKHSGVVESNISCGDLQCSAGESCSSCSADCGVCPDINTGGSSSSGRSSGGGSSTSSTIVTVPSTTVEEPISETELNRDTTASPQTTTTTQPVSDTPVDSAKSSRNIIFIVIMMILVFLIAGLIFVYYLISKKKKADMPVDLYG